MKDILRQWYSYQGDRDDEDAYDSVDEFFAGLSRGEMANIIVYLKETIDLR
jgi:hypothetical protein